MERGGLRGGCEPSDNMELNYPPPPVIVPPEEDEEEPEEEPPVPPELQIPVQPALEGFIVGLPGHEQYVHIGGDNPLEDEVPLGLLLQQHEEEVDLDNKPFWCPFYFCQAVQCMWDGYTCEDLYEHFENNLVDHNVGVVQAKEVNDLTLCEWPNFITNCDLGGEASGSYCLMMQKDPDMLFFLSAKCSGTTNSRTDIHVVYIGEEEPTNEYVCNINIQNRGEQNLGRISLSLTCGYSNTKSDIISIKADISESKDNTNLKAFCAENGSLYFWVELYADVTTESMSANDIFGDIDDIEEELEVD